MHNIRSTRSQGQVIISLVGKLMLPYKANMFVFDSNSKKSIQHLQISRLQSHLIGGSVALNSADSSSLRSTQRYSRYSISHMSLSISPVIRVPSKRMDSKFDNLPNSFGRVPDTSVCCKFNCSGLYPINTNKRLKLCKRR